MKKQKKDPLYKSFGYAFAGIFAVVTKERNMKIHCVAMVCVVIAGFVFHITPVEWCICLTLFGLVMALEMVNTAVDLFQSFWKACLYRDRKENDLWKS